MPKVSYRIHDPELNDTFDTPDPKRVSDYITDPNFDSPVHVETLHDGKVVKRETHHPKDWHVPKGSKYAFRN